MAWIDKYYIPLEIRKEFERGVRFDTRIGRPYQEWYKQIKRNSYAGESQLVGHLDYIENILFNLIIHRAHLKEYRIFKYLYRQAGYKYGFDKKHNSKYIL